VRGVGTTTVAFGTAAIMRRRARCRRNLRTRALICGLPSISLCSSRTSWRVMRIWRAKLTRARTQSAAAISAWAASTAASTRSIKALVRFISSAGGIMNTWGSSGRAALNTK